MKEKLLELLNAKYLGKGVRKDGLAQLAASLALTVTNDEEVQALVDKLTDDQVTDFVKEWRREVDAEVSNANKTLQENLKKKFNLVEKKTADPTDPPKVTGEPTDMAAVIRKALEEAVAPLKEEIQAFKGANTAKTRLEKLQETLKDAPAIFRENTLKNFNRMNFQDDQDFETYVADTASDLDKYNQENKEEGLKRFGHPVKSVNEPTGKDVSPETKAYIELKTADTNPLGGKAIN